jgi:hypothetical protein
MSSQDSVRKSDCGCQFCASHVAIKESFLMWSSSYQVGGWSNLSISTPDSKFPARYKTVSAARYRALSKPLCIPILTKFAVYDKLSWMSQAMFLQKKCHTGISVIQRSPWRQMSSHAEPHIPGRLRRRGIRLCALSRLCRTQRCACPPEQCRRWS